MFFYKDTVINTKSKEELFNSQTVCPVCGGPLHRDWSMPVRYSPMAMFRFLILAGAIAMLLYLLVIQIDPVHMFLNQFRYTVRVGIIMIGLACLSLVLAFVLSLVELKLGHWAKDGMIVYGCRCKTCKSGFAGLVNRRQEETSTKNCMGQNDLPAVYILSGPSGVGKSTIARLLKDADLPLRFPVSATDRAPRPGEIDGVSYHFKTPDEFQKMVEDQAFIEYVELEHRYGTPWSEIENATGDLVLDLDVTGAMEIRKYYPNAVLIFIAPPSMDELARRIRARNDGMPESEIQRRLLRAESELSYAGSYDCLITNHDIQQTFEEVLRVIKKHQKTCQP